MSKAGKRTGLLRKIKIQLRLIVSYLTLSIVPLLVVGIISFSSVSSILSSVIKQYTTQVINQFGDNVTKEMQMAMDVANSFVNSNMVQSDYSKYNSLGRFDRINLNNDILKELTLKVSQNSRLSGITFYPSSGESAIYSGSQDFGVSHTELAERLASESVPSKWYVDETGRLVFARKTTVIASGGNLGTIFVYINPTLLAKSFNELKLGDSVEVLFLTEEGQTIYSNNVDYQIGSIYSDTSIIDAIKTGQDLEGESRKSFEADLGNGLYCNYYKVDKTPFYVAIKIPDSFLTSAAKVVGKQIGTVAAVAIAIGLVVGFVVSKTISKPLLKLVEMMRKTKQGDLTKVVEDNSNDEIGEVISNYNEVVINIKELIRRVQISCVKVTESSNKISALAEQTNISSEQIANTMQEVARGSTEQAGEAMQSVDYMNELSEGMNKVTSDLNEILELISKTEGVTTNAISKVKLLNDKAVDAKTASEKIVEEIGSLNNDIKNINNIVKIIVQIAEQTNLLSLNAAIEAARAGEAGRGFAVVAGEINKLADQSKNSSKMIGDIIKSINMKAEHAVLEANSAHGTIVDQMRAVEQTDTAFYDITVSMKEIADLMHNMEISVENIQSLKTKTQLSMENISSVSEESAAITEEVSAATDEQKTGAQKLTNLSKEMNKTAVDLEEAVSLFTVEG